MKNDYLAPKNDYLARSELTYRMTKNRQTCPICVCDLNQRDTPITTNSCLLKSKNVETNEPTTDTKTLPICTNESELLKKFSRGMGEVAYIFRLDQSVSKCPNFDNSPLTKTTSLMFRLRLLPGNPGILEPFCLEFNFRSYSFFFFFYKS